MSRQRYSIVMDGTEATAKRVQEKLFEYGFYWTGIGQKIYDTTNIQLNYKNGNYDREPLELSYSSDPEYLARYIHDYDVKVITPEYLLMYIDEMDLEKKPVKKLTMAEVSKLLGYDVEIVKG